MWGRKVGAHLDTSQSKSRAPGTLWSNQPADSSEAKLVAGEPTCQHVRSSKSGDGGQTTQKKRKSAGHQPHGLTREKKENDHGRKV